jgi:hypothetical protein
MTYCKLVAVSGEFHPHKTHFFSLFLSIVQHHKCLCGSCNTPGVCHQLGSGFELKHDRLSGDDDVKVNLWR